ncbi:MAG: hypothetical protein AABM30_12955 [Actinomycetota bacterium]
MPEPVETPKRLFRRAARGKDETTPAIVLGGVTLVIAIVVAVLVAAVLLVYFLV